MSPVPSNFRDEARRIIRRAHEERLKILVWGPGDPGPAANNSQLRAYDKRRKIRDTLRREFPRAEVYLSEDPDMVEVAGGISDQLVAQAMQADISDLILMLDMSRGVDLELDHFVPTYPGFRDKTFVLIPDRYAPPRGLVKEVFDYLHPRHVKGFSRREFSRCDLANKTAVQIAEQVAIDLRLRGLI